MPAVHVLLYKEDDGTIPILGWLDSLPSKVQDKCVARIKRLRDLGHELRRPEADYLRDGIYELRLRHQTVNYRVLYFFHGNSVVVLTNGLTKEKQVAPGDIDKAIALRKRFDTIPVSHIYRWEI
jgi:phage-related protein